MPQTSSLTESNLAGSLSPRGSLRWQVAARRIFSVVAWVECFTWVGLLTGMLFKHFINGSGLGVTVFGWAHGLTWLIYLAVGLAVALTFRWKFYGLLLGLASSVLPFMTLPFERWVLRKGWLDTSAAQR